MAKPQSDPVREDRIHNEAILIMHACRKLTMHRQDGDATGPWC